MAGCQSQRRSVFSYLRRNQLYKLFLQVLTLLIVNINNQPATAFDAVFRAVGLDTISYRPPTSNLTLYNWPQIGSLIDNNFRLLTFLDNGADLTSVPYLIDGTQFLPRPVNFLF